MTETCSPEVLVVALSLSVPLLTPWKALADECIPLLIPLPAIGTKGGGESLRGQICGSAKNGQ